MNWPDYLLVAWSVAALGWWSLALLLLARTGRRPPPKAAPQPVRLTLFKSLPPVSDTTARDRIARAVDTFVDQLDDTSTLLLGVAAEAADTWRPCLEAWTQRVPAGRLRVLVLDSPRQRANPKIAWFERLAHQAGPGDVWLWSDADVVVPPAFLEELRAELCAGGMSTLTCAYCVRDASTPAHGVDALYVNLEFLPGALLLGRLGPLDFALGAVVAFPSQAFRAKVSWSDLGGELADDHALGRWLAPVQLSALLVETVPTTSGMGEALKHYYRWQKTVRWCRPLGFAALLLILPLAGWFARFLTGPDRLLAAGGMLAVWLAEVGIAWWGLSLVGCALGGRARWVLWGWPWLRCLAWLAVWLPLPVEWLGADPLWRRRRKPDRRFNAGSSESAPDQVRPGED